MVSVPPTKSQRGQQDKEKQNKESGIQKETEESAPDDVTQEDQTAPDVQLVKPESSPSAPYADTILLQPVSPVSSSTCNADGNMSSVITDASATDFVDFKTEQSPVASEHQAEHDTMDSSKSSALTSEPKSSTSDPLLSPSSKEAVLENKDSKAEDRQTDTPSPPVSAFSSGTSTTSDIEVLDHESVMSESSASSRQETGEGKTGLHLMQGSFQLLTASTCGDFPRLEDYPKLTESCGSSSDAFERIDSFSVQSLDSRSVSEVNSDDEIPGSRTLASVTAGPAPTVSSTVCQKQEECVVENAEEEEEGFPSMMRELSLDEMEESGRSATPVNSEQPEELTEQEQESETNVPLSDPSSTVGEQLTPPITEEMKSVSTVQILALQKVTAGLRIVLVAMMFYCILTGHSVVYKNLKTYMCLPPFQLCWEVNRGSNSCKIPWRLCECFQSPRLLTVTDVNICNIQ